MKKILHIISSPRGDASYSIRLGNAIIDKLQLAYADSVVKEVNLVDKRFPHLEEAHLNAFFTPEENRTPEDLVAIKHSNEAIAEIMESDIIVLGVPLYNFSIPSNLKAWIDHICRSGVTFKYSENGPEGLIKNKKLYIAFSSGGIYTDGPMAAYDTATPYLKSVFAFLGITDVTIIRAEGTSIPGIQDNTLAKGIESILIN
ncbi:FMN-dependent NADH-azoreductase [Pedobacter boryungensis]|uniref:FMN dependent NADH:quinone oxidoreductase n=1 Tax=Pedobacter boryungensis TaxID=869962 RepID=A0ABX2DC41_9SPHI|nr:NAD(P)H-dependent oxidoreductase [Pedobacter boryungensis]NQX31648.1 NAD(P)H-dependent oxidoreductase [Pedobacter boryungensis]